MLRIFESSLADVLEQHRAFYVADPEQGWRLDCDIDEVARRLLSALRAERESLRVAKKQLRRIEALLACTTESERGMCKDSFVRMTAEAGDA
jgi:hypothetical protein